jgi:hypothetical protein
MDDLEKYKRKIAEEIANLYGVKDGNKEIMFIVMFDTVRNGMLTFEELSSILKKIHIPNLTEFDAYGLCEFLGRISRKGIKVNQAIEEIRNVCENVRSTI